MKKGTTMSSEQKLKISESEKGRVGTWKNKKRPPFSDEHKRNLSISMLNHKPWNKGLKLFPLSEEHKRKISIATKGKKKLPFTNLHKERIKLARAKQIMLPCSEETKLKIKQKRALQKLPMRDSKPELLVQTVLKNNNISFEKHKMIKDGNGFFHQVDLFINPNICIEVDGDYWHCNPNKYHGDFVLKTRNELKVTAKDIWMKDQFINRKLTNMGYYVIRIWASEINFNLTHFLKDISRNILKVGV